MTFDREEMGKNTVLSAVAISTWYVTVCVFFADVVNVFVNAFACYLRKLVCDPD